MRRTFRKHPRIKIEDKGVYRIFSYDGSDPSPAYVPVENTIYLEGMRENRVIVDLNHEVNHWAIFGFMTLEEAAQCIVDSINWMLRKAPKPLIERVMGRRLT